MSRATANGRSWWFEGPNLHTLDSDGTERVYINAQQLKKEVIRPEELLKARAVIEQHRVLGQHFGIPRCCVSAYIDDFLAARSREYALQALEDEWEYVPCDTCFHAGKRQEIHQCTPDCGIEQLLAKR